jgi:hypothetical protein
VGPKMRNERINEEKENSGGIRRRPAARAQAIEKKPEGIGADKNRGRFDGVSGLALHGNDGENREKNEKEGYEEAGSGGKSQPQSGTDAALFMGEQRDGEEGQVGEAIKRETPDLEEFESFLIADASENDDAGRDGDSAEKKDGVDGRLVFGVETRDPLRQKVVPSGDHGEARVGGEVEAKGGEVIGEEKKDGGGNDDSSKAKPGEGAAERLRDRADDIDGVRGYISEDGAGAKDIEKGDERSGDEDSAFEVARRIAGFACKDGGVFESAERTESHFAENAEAEERERRSDEVQRAISGQRAAPPVNEWHEREESDEKYGEEAACFRDPLSNAQAEPRDKHQQPDHHDGSNENDPAICGHACGGGTDGVAEVVDGDQTRGGDVEDHVESEIPGHQEADAVVESQASPFIKAAFEGHQAIQMGDDERLRNEEQKNGEEPENDVSGTGFYGGAEEIRDYDEEDGGKNEIQVAEFLGEGGAARVEMRFCCGEIRANAGGQCAREPRDLRRA